MKLDEWSSEGGKGEGFLKGGWEVDGWSEGKAIQTFVQSVGSGWVAEQVSFSHLLGERL